MWHAISTNGLNWIDLDGSGTELDVLIVKDDS
jgi:hypothetical protein